MGNKKWWKTLSVILLGGLLAAFVIVPLPYYVEAPGATIDLKDMITVDDQEDKESGSFSLTSVGIRRATGFGVVSALLSDFQDVLSEEQLTGGATNEEYNQMQRYYMESSQNAAIEQALKLANIPYTMEFKGVYVMSVEKIRAFMGNYPLVIRSHKWMVEALRVPKNLWSMLKGKKSDRWSRSPILIMEKKKKLLVN